MAAPKNFPEVEEGQDIGKKGIIGGGRKSLMGLQWLKSQTEVNQPRKGITVPWEHQERRMKSNAGEFEGEEEAIHGGDSCLISLL